MPPIVAVIAPGMMGSAVAQRLTSAGVQVRTLLAGRSAASVARAQAAGLTDASHDQIAEADFILSIVPPGEALALAESLSPAMRAVTRKPVYVDCNAVSPETVLRIDRVVRESGARFVDGGIIGPPPEQDSSRTRIYLSGPDAGTVTVLEQYGLSMPVQPGPVGAASAMKMSYAGITKGFTALGATMMLAATRAGTVDALIDGDEGQPAGTAEMADEPDAEDAQQGLPLGRGDGRNRRIRRTRANRRRLLPVCGTAVREHRGGFPGAAR